MILYSIPHPQDSRSFQTWLLLTNGMTLRCDPPPFCTTRKLLKWIVTFKSSFMPSLYQNESMPFPDIINSAITIPIWEFSQYTQTILQVNLNPHLPPLNRQLQWNSPPPAGPQIILFGVAPQPPCQSIAQLFYTSITIKVRFWHRANYSLRHSTLKLFSANTTTRNHRHAVVAGIWSHK